ncbi:MAG: hypothetical protein WCV90_05095 [Candidatus Woesearchaeota archaeon]|jgi:hypothetical protein
MAYYFLGQYDPLETKNALLGGGYSEQEFELFGIKCYRYLSRDGAFTINLTSPTEGKMQIQGAGPNDISLNKEQSSYYPTLETLVKILNPKRIVDEGVEDVFPNLLKTSS